MTLLNDEWIAQQSKENQLIRPFVEKQVRSIDSKPVISYGLSSCGYDITLDGQFRVFTYMENKVIDPKNFDQTFLDYIEADSCIIPPNSFALALSVETFKIPTDVMAICIGKSTYARCGIIINVTPFEPGWEGRAVIEISNTTPLPAKIYAFEGIAQVIFLKSNAPCLNSYADKSGKYQQQKEILLPQA
jgi:dCTP deaminase